MLSPAALAQAQLDAYNARDIDAFCAVYADDVILIDLVSGAPFCTGNAAMRERYGAMFDRCPELHCKLVYRMVCGNMVIDQEYVTGQQAGIAVDAIATYETSNGKITRAWFIRDNQER